MLSNTPLPTSEVVVIPTVNGMVRMRQSYEIKYIAGSGPISELYIQCGRVLKSTRGLVHYQRLLDIPQGYYRFSQSLLVNMAYIDGVHTRKQEVTLRCGTTLSISRRCCQQFKKWCRGFDQGGSENTDSEDHEPNHTKTEYLNKNQASNQN